MKKGLDRGHGISFAHGARRSAMTLAEARLPSRLGFGHIGGACAERSPRCLQC